MKKILALVLTLAMMLTMLNVGFVASAAGAEIPAGATAINDAAGLAGMQAGGTYYLAADITIGSPITLNEDENGPIADDILEMGEEAEIITIPAGVTLYGNGKTIYMGYYKTNPADFTNKSGNTGPGTHSADWTHGMFKASAGDKITFIDVNFGSEELPIYLDQLIGYPDAWSAVGMFEDEAGANVEFDGVDFYFERYAGGLDNANLGPIGTVLNGSYTFKNCTKSGFISNGSQFGGWIYKLNNAASTLTMDNCQAYGTVNGSHGAGIIHSMKGGVNITITNYTNYANQTHYYGSGTGGFWSTMVGNFGGAVDDGELYMENCANYGNVSVNAAYTIGGAILGRTASKVQSIQLINCDNYGNVTRSGAGVSSNHGYGAIAGHTGANTTYTLTGCDNYGDIQGTACFGGIIGLKEGTAPLNLTNCNNYGDLTGATSALIEYKEDGVTVKTKHLAAREIAGIVGQWRDGGTFENCVNYGTLSCSVGGSIYMAGMAGTIGSNDLTDGTAVFNLENCVNYGSIGGTNLNYAAGMIASRYNKTAQINLTGCVNYGQMLTQQYSAGMIAELSGSVATIDACINYGDILGHHAVAGMVAQTNGNVTITNSVNAGRVDSYNGADSEGVGGFIGRVDNATRVIAISDSANLGIIESSTKNSAQYGAFGDTVGQFIGGYFLDAAGLGYTADITVGGFRDFTAEGAVKPTITDCFAYGEVSIPEGAKSLTGWITKDSTGTSLDDGNADNGPEYSASTVPATVANNGLFGVNVVAVATRVETLAAVLPEDAIDVMSEIFGLTVMEGTDGEAPLVIATPELRGYQQTTDKTAIRFAAVIRSLNYDKVGFIYSAEINGVGTATDVEVVSTEVWSALNANTNDGAIEAVTATQLGGTYITAITFNNVPAEGEVILTITPVADDYTGTGYVVTIVDGVVTSVVDAVA